MSGRDPNILLWATKKHGLVYRGAREKAVKKRNLSSEIPLRGIGGARGVTNWMACTRHGGGQGGGSVGLSFVVKGGLERPV